MLCVEFLEPLRTKFGPIYINSGYRSLAVNTAIGGSKTSSHMFGCAADLDPVDSSIRLQTIVNWIIDESGLDYDQVILESSSTSNWIHLGMKQPNRTNARKEALRFKDGKYAKYNKLINYGV